MGVVSLGDISHLIFRIVFVVVRIQSLEGGVGRALQLLSHATFTAVFFFSFAAIKSSDGGAWGVGDEERCRKVDKARKERVVVGSAGRKRGHLQLTDVFILVTSKVKQHWTLSDRAHTGCPSYQS